MPRIIKSAKGTFTSATITVDGQGRVVAASSGSAGGKGFVFAVGASNNETVTYTASPLATGDIYGALIGGGGAGGTSTDGVKYPAGITIYGRWTKVVPEADADGGIICYFGL